jgi:putative oxidoreductase
MIIPTKSSAWFLLLARVFMATLFVFAGVEKIFKYGDVTSFAASYGVPFSSTLMPAAIALELGCAAMLLTRRYCRVAALILAIWTFVLNLVFHQFWNVPDNIWQLMVDNFFHSFVMVGGLMYVVVYGAGKGPDPVQPISAVE